MVDPVHPEPEPKKAKARVTVTTEFDLSPENYLQVEWPPDSGELKNLTDPQEMLEFERWQLTEGDSDITELLGGDENIKVELVEEPLAGAAHLDYAEDRARAAREETTPDYIQDRGSGRDYGPAGSDY